ncbi:MAG: ATP-binding protein [Oscillospiraceae bacterium]|nr:ATP-binding protein [Oscillospiraceae bacterium]
MRSSFLSPEQVFAARGLTLFESVGAAAPATDLALLTADDDGFLVDAAGGVNYYLSDGGCVDRFGRSGECAVCAVRPAILLEQGDEALLQRPRRDGTLTTVEYGVYPTTVLDVTLRDMAAGALAQGTLRETGKRYTIAGESVPVYQLGAKQVVCLTAERSYAAGFAQLSDGTCVSEGERVFLELRPVRWFYDAANALLVCCRALFAGLDRAQAEAYLAQAFLSELAPDETEELPGDAPYRYEQRDELSLIRAYAEADIPVFLHGLSGDGKSDRVRQIDPQALDIELVNETPETINGRAIYNEAHNEIVDVKPVWLVKLERLCEDGKLHLLFFDELTNATKQTQSVIFKIVLERVVNNRWPLPENARIVAAGNDRSESSAAHDLAEPLFGRFAHIYIRTTVENWMPWAVRSRINPYVMEFLANNDLYLRTPYTGTEGHADPRRWEMVSRALDATGNDFSLLAPIVGRDTAEAFVRFFRAQQQLAALGHYTDEELARFSVARRYQLAQQCLYLSAARPEEARALVERLGPEFLAWFDYVQQRKRQARQ